jgi:type I restriction enzyme, S subunit
MSVKRSTLEAETEFVLDGTHGSPVRVDDGVPVLSAQNVIAGELLFETSRFTTDEEYRAFARRLTPKRGDVLLTIVGTIGRAAVLAETPPPIVFQRSVSIIRPRAETLDSRFLYYVTQSDDFKRQIDRSTNKSSQAGVYLKKLKQTNIPLPPLAEQKRIAGILDAADALRAKRRESLVQLDTLLQSTFLHLFGDPVTNPMEWDVEQLDSWLENIDSGWSPKCLERQAEDGEWGVLKLGAVTWCEFDETDQKALPPDLEPRPELEVCKGDLLFTRKNTYELVAAAAYVHSVRPKLMLPDLIFRLRLGREVEVEPKFLWQLLIEPHQRQMIQKLAGGAAGSMPNISKAKLRAVKLIRPPLDLQRRFATIVESVERQKTRMRAHLAELDALFASLQSRAFNGEL